MANIITAGNSTNGGTAISTDTSGTLNIVTGSGSGSNAITIDASQAVTMPGNLTVTGTLTATGGVSGGLGTGQTWQAVTRTSGTTYTNSTSKPIIFAPFYSGSIAGYISLTIGGFNLGLFGTNGAACGLIGAFVVPPGSTYVYTATGTSPSSISELR
jgi:hypothetical protein